MQRAPLKGVNSLHGYAWAALLLLSAILNVVFVANRATPSKEDLVVTSLVHSSAPYELDPEAGFFATGLGIERALASSGIGDDPGMDNGTNLTMHEGSHASHGEAHQTDALFFLFNALVVGAGLMHAATFFHSVQQTVALFVFGVIFSFLLEGLDLRTCTGIFGDSYNMWMSIDPHLLLFTLLPALLAGDAMSIDTNIARRVGFQCLWLAGPGILISALLVGGFLHLWLGWDFLLSLVTSAILCATDPVAVVALLKELGASPVLTVQIQGESLLNDGTAIVLYMVAYNMLSGETYDVADIVMFLVQTALMAWVLGIFIGYLFFTWIRFASNKLRHGSSMIQISLTICNAYWSFIIAEGVFHISGVLATVASSLVLAHNMWPHVVSRESMDNAWHTVEGIGNTVIFFLAGALTGNAMVKIEWGDYLHLVLLYIVLMVTRAALIFGSRPILRMLSQTKRVVSVQDATVMTWGGLRGAVGLALAIQVHIGRAGNAIEDRDAQRVMFFVSGIAFLTMVVNATTAPTLVKRLGVTAMPLAQKKLLKLLYQQLVNFSVTENNPESVTQSIQEMLDHVAHQFQQEAAKDLIAAESFRSKGTDGSIGSQESKQSSVACEELKDANMVDSMMAHRSTCRTAQDNVEIVAQYHVAATAFHALPAEDVKMLGKLPQESLLGKVDDMLEIVGRTRVDEGVARATTKVFLNMVLANYWKQMKNGDLRPGSGEADVLFTSIRVALSPLRSDLTDFRHIEEHIRSFSRKDPRKWWKIFPDEDSGRKLNGSGKLRIACRRMVQSSVFSIFIAIMIFLNCLTVAAEEAAGDSYKDQPHVAWLVIEILFTIVFLTEALLKLGGFHYRYFLDAQNVFDFVLVVLGIFGVTVSIISAGEEDGVENKSNKIVKVSRVFRVLRFLRVFRLLHAMLSFDRDVSVDVAERMHKITTLLCFVRAHLGAEVELEKYFGGTGTFEDVSESEIARCILQSQICVYQAVILAVGEVEKMERVVLMELLWAHERKRITESLEVFVLDAHKVGAISAREAESILTPLHKHISECLKEISDYTEGRLVPGAEGTIDRTSAGSGFKSLQRKVTEASAGIKDSITSSMELVGFKSRKFQLPARDLRSSDVPVDSRRTTAELVDLENCIVGMDNILVPNDRSSRGSGHIMRERNFSKDAPVFEEEW